MIDIPLGQSIYVCHFVKPIEETFLKKIYGQVGRIREIHFGEYKNKACNKRKRRTIYFAIIVYKYKDDCQKIL